VWNRRFAERTATYWELALQGQAAITLGSLEYAIGQKVCPATSEDLFGLLNTPPSLTNQPAC
jgi:hypothetical protein